MCVCLYVCYVTMEIMKFSHCFLYCQFFLSCNKCPHCCFSLILTICMFFLSVSRRIFGIKFKITSGTTPDDRWQQCLWASAALPASAHHGQLTGWLVRSPLPTTTAPLAPCCSPSCNKLDVVGTEWEIINNLGRAHIPTRFDHDPDWFALILSTRRRLAELVEDRRRKSSATDAISNHPFCYGCK